MYNRDYIIEVAKQELGKKEFPANSNKIEYNEWYYEETDQYHVSQKNGTYDPKLWAWCATFLSWVFHRANSAMPKVNTENGFHYVPTLYYKWKALKINTTEPKKGDIFTVDFNLDGKIDHTGLFVEWIIKGKEFWSIEGNTTPDGKTGSQANGGEVCLKKRKMTGVTFFNFIDNLDKFN